MKNVLDSRLGDPGLKLGSETKTFLVVSTVLSVSCLNVRQLGHDFFFKYPVHFTLEHVIKARVPALDGDW